MKIEKCDCEECVNCDYRVYDNFSPLEPYCLIYNRFIVDMRRHNESCCDFEPVEEDGND